MARTTLSRIGLALLILSVAVGSVRAAVITVPGNANIFGAGHAVPPAPGGWGAGSLPPVFNFPAGSGQILTFSSVTGSVRIDNNENPLYSNGPDGGNLFTRTDVSSYGGISGVIHDARTMFLVGVFLDDSEPSDPAPPRLDFSSSALGDNFTTLAPQLRQVFFIGDGLTGTGSGTVQQFYVPAGATRLFFGFADAFDVRTGTITGLPGFYDDNDGQLVVTFEITSASVVPEPSTLMLMGVGVAMLGVRLCRRTKETG